jgi:hypothetical protein
VPLTCFLGLSIILSQVDWSKAASSVFGAHFCINSHKLAKLSHTESIILQIRSDKESGSR